MKAIIHFQLALTASIGLATSACSPPEPPAARIAPQAIRAVEVRMGTLVQGRKHLAEVVPEQSVKVIAQVHGTVTAIPIAEGDRAVHGTALVRVSTPDVAARVARVRSERKRAERERDFACSTVKTDRALAKSGDLASAQLDRSERSCASAQLAAEGARAGEREASVAKARSVQRAPFDGEVLMHWIDEGQTVMPGSPLLQYASRERLLRLRVPESDLEGIEVGGPVTSEIGTGRVFSIGTQALGPGRVIEILLKMDEPPRLRVGTTLSTTLIAARADNASAVPDGAIGDDDGAHYIMVIEDNKLRRVDITIGVREAGWNAVTPALPKGTQIAVGDIKALDPTAPILVVRP